VLAESFVDLVEAPVRNSMFVAQSVLSKALLAAATARCASATVASGA
jgi:hypothetical protein